MSYELFKQEVKASLSMPQNNVMVAATTLATAYNNLILRGLDTLSGGGVFLLGAAQLPIMINGFASALQQNVQSSNSSTNIFSQMAPYIEGYWAGNTAFGSAGVTTITYSGNFFGPPLVPNNNFDIFLNAFVVAIQLHLLTLIGTHVNASGVTVPWSGALFMITP